MIVKGITRDILVSAAEKIGVAVDITTLNAKGTRHRVKVNALTLVSNYRTAVAKNGQTYQVRYQDGRGDAPYQRESVSYGCRRVHAVCWHGFRDFFRAAFAQAPDAVFKTAVDTWKGSEDFEQRFPESGYKNIGPPVAPVRMVDACRCPDSGYAK